MKIALAVNVQMRIASTTVRSKLKTVIWVLILGVIILNQRKIKTVTIHKLMISTVTVAFVTECDR